MIRRSHRRKQAGYLLLNLLIGTVTGSLVVVAIVNAALGRMRDKELERALVQATSIAQVADSNGTRVTGTTVDASTRVYTYAHAGRSATYRAVTQLNTDYGLQLPVVSPWGTPYEYLSNGQLAVTRFVIPAASFAGLSIDPIYFREVLAGGDIRVYAQALRNPYSIQSRRMRSVKRDMYLETTR